MKKIINWYSVIKESDLYSSSMLAISKKLSSGENHIIWNAVVSNENHCPKGFRPILFEEKGEHASSRHASGLNHIVKVCQGDYVVIADTDVVILQKDWDQVLIKELYDNDASLIGGVLREGKRETKYPNIIFTMYEQKTLKECNPDFSPVIENGNIVIRDGRKLDTAWNVDYYFRNHKCICMEHVYALSQKAQLGFNEHQKKIWLDYYKKDSRGRQHMTEFHLKNSIFCTHMIGGRSKKIYKFLFKTWIQRINKYLLDTYGI